MQVFVPCLNLITASLKCLTPKLLIYSLMETKERTLLFNEVGNILITEKLETLLIQE